MRVRTGMAASVGIVAVMLAVSAWAWAQLPADAQLPVHWGLSGEADRYGSKAEGLLAVPVIAFLVAGVFAVLPKVEPRRAHLEESAGAYFTVWLAIMAMLALTHGALVAAALGYPVNVASTITGGVGLLFLALGWVLGDIRSNFMFGVRTPWTLTSELSWRRTHELAGKLFMGLGALVALLALVAPPPVLFAVLMGGLLVVTLIVLVYSWQMWRIDPARQAGR